MTHISYTVVAKGPARLVSVNHHSEVELFEELTKRPSLLGLVCHWSR